MVVLRKNYIRGEECFFRLLTKEAETLIDYTIDPVYNFANVVEYRSGMKTTKPYMTNARNQVILADHSPLEPPGRAP